MSDEWPYKYESGGKISTLLAEPDSAIERARFIGKFPYEVKVKAGKEHPIHGAREEALENLALLNVLVSARHIRESRDLDEWSQFAEEYPLSTLDKDHAKQKSNADALVRAHYIYEAIARLLELADAPQAMRNDFQLLIERQRPTRADQRAEAQKRILENPKAGLREIARDSEYDPGELSRDIKKRYILWPGKNVT